MSPEDQFVDSHESSGFKLGDDQYVLFDHSGLINEYKSRLVNNHARYAALRQDFEKLEDKYNSLLLTNETLTTSLKTNVMETNTNSAALAHAGNWQKERDELIARLDDANLQYEKLQKENESLLQQVKVGQTTANENYWSQENKELKDRLLEQECLKDLLEEKQAHTDFLQSQLDQRIKNFHQSERQRDEISAELKKMQQELTSEINQLKNEITQRDEQTHQLLSDKDAAIEEKQQLLLSSQNQITYLENVLREVREQNEMLNAAVADNQEKAANLEQLVDDGNVRLGVVEQRLHANKQLLQRLYREFSACIDHNTDEPPVVSLRSVTGHSAISEAAST